MTYKTILVHVGADADGADAVKLALSIGAGSGATVIGIGAVGWDPYVDPTLGYVDAGTITALRNDVDTDILAAEAAFRSACAGYAHPTIWRTAANYPERAVIDLSRCADLIVASYIPDTANDRHYADPVTLVMESGLPVLLASVGRDCVPPATIMVGWKDTRETRRAISNAMPLLKTADRIVVTGICKPAERPAVERELEDVVGRLERQGVPAEWQSFAQTGIEADVDLIRVAGSLSADLIVLGAYGHSRMHEWAFGGVTRDLITGSATPILFSH